MRITLIVNKLWQSTTALKGCWSRTLVSLCVFGLPMSAGLAVGYAIGHQPANPLEGHIEKSSAASDNASAAPVVPDEQRMQTLKERMVALEARVGRLDILGERVADMAQVEIDNLPAPTSKLPAIGGPSQSETTLPQPQDIYAAIDHLTQQIDDREQQFEDVQALLASRSVGEQALFGAQPVLHSDISSYFGMRIDPVTGVRNMHDGIDFSGKAGTAIMAAADGVVTFAANKQGYGRLIEVNHGDDCFTRYAHSKLIFVKPGDVVKKGQVIALMGSTGRTTGTHLHFEVYKHGRPVDPYIYIRQASR